jgi:hypothetical protein
MIAAGATKVIALTGAFNLCGDAGACNAMPDYEIPFPGQDNSNVTNMIGLYDGTASNFTNFGFLTNGGEDLVLYKWDGASATVQDVDYFVWGTSPSYLSDKSGVPGYQNDTPIASQKPVTATSATGTSYQRACYNENGETMSGGNGISGHDETSENLPANWSVGAPNFGVKTPGSTP